MHYLVRRAEFERNAVYSGDEIDLLALYVQTGFNIGEAEFERVPLLLEDKHECLESFLMQLAPVRFGHPSLGLIPADRSRGAAAGAPGIAVIPAGTPVQKVIKAVVNYYDPMRSTTRKGIIQENTVTNSMLRHCENNYS